MLCISNRLMQVLSGVRPTARSFASDRRGTIAILAAFAIFPLVGAVAIALDYSRAFRAHSALQSAIDAAALSAARLGNVSTGQINTAATAFFEANGGRARNIDGLNLSILKTPTGVKIEAAGTVKPYFLPVIGINTVDVSAVAEAATDPGDLEIVLALDNTGSMRGYMGDLKTASRDLVNAMFDATNNSSKLKIGIVPYVGAVNIGNGGTQMNWMDQAGDARWHGQTFEWQWVAMQSGCVLEPDTGGGGGSSGPGNGTGGGDRSSLHQSWSDRFADGLRAIVGINRAYANSGPTVPPGYTSSRYRGCDFLVAPSKVNHFDLLARIPNTQWKGCVEARAEPYDVTIEPPRTSNPDTMFVPYFWPDEPDQSRTDVNRFPNDFMADSDPPAGWSYEWEGGRHRNIWKYSNVAGTIVETGPVSKGPNQACPDPIRPLTNSRSDLLSAINNLSHWEGSGTVSSEGLMWAWRVLSRDSGTFSEAKAKGEATKVIVLMTDGQNAAAEQASWSSFTDYTAYGYLQGARVAPMTYQGYKSHIDSRLSLACANAKADGVTIYTVTFGNLDVATQGLYDACATRPSYHYSATTAADLVAAFRDIAVKLTALRLVN